MLPFARFLLLSLYCSPVLLFVCETPPRRAPSHEPRPPCPPAAGALSGRCFFADLLRLPPPPPYSSPSLPASLRAENVGEAHLSSNQNPRPLLCPFSPSILCVAASPFSTLNKKQHSLHFGRAVPRSYLALIPPPRRRHTHHTTNCEQNTTPTPTPARRRTLACENTGARARLLGEPRHPPTWHATREHSTHHTYDAPRGFRSCSFSRPFLTQRAATIWFQFAKVRRPSL